jgi:predicted N-acyltransferase
MARKGTGMTGNYKLMCYDSIEEIDGERWRAMGGNRHIAYSPEYMRYLEAQEPGSRPILMLSDSQGAPLAACCFAEFCIRTPAASKPVEILTDRQNFRIGDEDIGALTRELRLAVTRHSEGAVPHDLDGVLREAKRLFAALVGMPAMVRNLWDSRVLLADGLDSATRRYALARMIEAVKAEALRRGYRSVAFVYAPSGSRGLVRALSAAGFVTAHIESVAEIDLRGCETFDDYIVRFRANGRRMIKREMYHFNEAKLDVRRVDHDSVADRLAALERNNVRKYGGNISIRTLLEAHAYLRQKMTDRLVTCGIFRSDELIASAIMLRGTRELQMLSYGADYQIVDQLRGPYGHAVYYWPIQYALENGLRAVNLAVGSYEAKLQRGAHLESRHMSIWTATPEAKSFLTDWLPIVDARNARYFQDMSQKYARRMHPAEDG